MRRLGKEMARLEPVVNAFRRLQDIRAELAGVREMREGESDPGLKEMAQDELERLTAEEAAQVEAIRLLLIPRDPNDERNVIMEIRAGAGGEEAALFAGDLLRMYLRYAQEHRLRAEILHANETGIGGFKEVIVQIIGNGAYSRLKYEGGVHRVQRIPATESAAGCIRRPPPSWSCRRPKRSRSTSTRRRTSASRSSAHPARAASP